MRINRLLIIIKYWLKVISSEDTKFIKCVYKMMLNDAEDHPTKINSATLVRNLLSELGFYEVRIQQGVGNFFLRFLNKDLRTLSFKIMMHGSQIFQPFQMTRLFKHN